MKNIEKHQKDMSDNSQESSDYLRGFNRAINEAVKVIDEYGMPPFDKITADKIKELKQ